MTTETPDTTSPNAYAMSVCDAMSEEDIEEQYREALDESGPVTIGTLEYDPSDVLEAVDPVAYRCGFADYVSFLLDDSLVEGTDGLYYRKDEWDEAVEEWEEMQDEDDA